MSNRLSKGTIVAGKLSQDQPGFPKMGPAVRISAPASTAEIASGFTFGSDDVVSGFMVKVLAIGATSGTLSLGLMTTGASGFVVNLPVGSTGIKGTMYSVSTSGSSPTAFFNGSYLGPLLGAAYSGTTEGSTGGVPAAGSLVTKLYACDASTEKRLSYAVAGSTGLTTFSALVYPIYYTLNS
jgi:hypothetical protein